MKLNIILLIAAALFVSVISCKTKQYSIFKSYEKDINIDLSKVLISINNDMISKAKVITASHPFVYETEYYTGIILSIIPSINELERIKHQLKSHEKIANTSQLIDQTKCIQLDSMKGFVPKLSSYSESKDIDLSNSVIYKRKFDTINLKENKHNIKGFENSPCQRNYITAGVAINEEENKVDYWFFIF